MRLALSWFAVQYRFVTSKKLCCLLTLVGTLITGCGDSTAESPHFDNPVVMQRADPWVHLHSDGWYYFIATVPEYDRIELRRARTIEELAAAEPKVIWRKHEAGVMGAHIWAPELHHIEGKWYIHFAAGEAEHVWAIRPFVLENESPNPLEGEWVEKGAIKTKWESFSLDATTFEHRGRRYLVWAQRDPSVQNNTDLYIAEMDTPWSIFGEQVMLSRPEFDWELLLYKVNEGAAVLKRNGRIFISYSASGTNHFYCMGLLTADENADLLDPASWSKSPNPVFQTSEENGIYGPGHNCFTTTPDGESDILIYHARSYKEIEGDPLDDPNRHTRAQALNWNDDGTPNFGVPEADAVKP